jgi:hypothetical protein
MTYVPSPHFTQNWVLSKPSAQGRRGIVVSQARSAAEAGVAILDAGGNAVDAAVAAALALATVEPWNSGLGGIGFALVHRAGQPTAEVVDFGPVAPRNLDPSAFKLTGRMKQDLFAWPEVEGDCEHSRPAVVRDPIVHGRLRAHARHVGKIAAGGDYCPSHSPREARIAAGLVHHVESGLLRVGVAPLRLKRPHLSARRFAASRALPGIPGIFPAWRAGGKPSGR